MEAKHIITQVIGTAMAVWIVRWGAREFRGDWLRERRLPLVTGPFMVGTLLAVAGVIAAVVPVFVAIFKLELVPKGSPAPFIAMMAWVSLGTVFAILGATTRQARRSARGWISVIGDGALRVEVDGTTTALSLRPGAARLRFIEGEGVGGVQYVQLDIDDGAAHAHVWGMLGIRDLKLVSPGRLPQAQGLMVATSIRPLCRWLAPYLAKE